MAVDLFAESDWLGPAGGTPADWKVLRDITPEEKSRYPESVQGSFIWAIPPCDLPGGTEGKLALRWIGPTSTTWYALTDGYVIQADPERASWLPPGWVLSFFPTGWSAGHLDRWYEIVAEILKGKQDTGSEVVVVNNFNNRDATKPKVLLDHTRLILRHLSLASVGRWAGAAPTVLRPDQQLTPVSDLGGMFTDGFTQGDIIYLGGKPYALTLRLTDLLAYLVLNPDCPVEQVMKAKNIKKESTLRSYLTRIRDQLAGLGLDTLSFEMKARKHGRIIRVRFLPKPAKRRAKAKNKPRQSE